MRVKYFTSAVTAAALSTCAMVSHANNGNENNSHNWMPKQPDNMYWQAPNFSFPPTYNTAPPAYNPPPAPVARENTYQPPAQQQRAPAYRPPQRPAYNNYPAPNMNNRGGDNRRQYYNGGNQGNMNRPAPNANMNQNMNQNSNRGYPQPPRGQYGPGYRPDNGASAYNTPGYNRNRNNNNNSGWGNNGWNNNKFWGQSGPNKWMNPNKRNMEQGWDDMINGPSRMGEMPGGWTAPEISMPNPIDMGDQMQDNVKDLPEQIRNMDVGN